MPTLRTILLALATVFVTYLVIEAATTELYLRGAIEPVSIWMHERTDPAGNIRFDPVSGARLSSTPARIASIATNGVVETVGTYRGNNHGFPDPDDFEPAHLDPATVRLAVFGDSFTHAQYFAKSWPERVEDATRGSERPLELLNFSLDGAGLANWTSVLVRFVEARGYELDGVVFAVWGEDLKRTFTWWDDRPGDAFAGEPVIRTGSSLRWALDATPRTLAEAGGYHKVRWYVVSSSQLDRALAGEWRPPFRRPFERPFLWIRAARALDAARGAGGRGAQRPGGPRFDPGQQRLVAEIHRVLEAMRLPALVVRVPNSIELASWEGEAELFARQLGARYVDGGLPFQGLDEGAFAASWLPYDRHWSQAGSDRFAAFMTGVLADWP